MTLSYLLLVTIPLGLLAGTMAGLLGLGGGTVIVPVLFWLFRGEELAVTVAMPMALATALAVVVCTTASAAISHQRAGNLAWPIIRRYLPWMMLGGLCGSQLAGHIDNTALVWLFPVFLLIVAGRLSGLLPTQVRMSLPFSRWQQRAAAFFFGNLSIFLGLGGSVFLVPHLIKRHQLTMPHAIGTATACATGTASVGMLGYMLYVAPVHTLPGGSIGYVYWPLVIIIGISGLLTVGWGTQLAKTLPETRIKRIFAAMLVAVACSLWASA